jgi:hypothetical protein
MLLSSSICVLLHKLWNLLYVTWRIFHSDTCPQFIPFLFFLLYDTQIAIRFRHWSSRATPGTPASLIYKDECMFVRLYLIQIHISEPIGTKLCTWLPLHLEETVGYV